jgi:hypothetical protein
VEREAGHIAKGSVGPDEFCADAECRSRNPEIIRVRWIAERMTEAATCGTGFGNHSQQLVLTGITVVVSMAASTRSRRIVPHSATSAPKRTSVTVATDRSSW